MRTLTAEPGEHINAFCARLAAEASARRSPVLGEFNNHTLVAAPGSTPDEVAAPFHDWSRRDYFDRLTPNEKRTRTWD